jgi:hypothetical protein
MAPTNIIAGITSILMEETIISGSTRGVFIVVTVKTPAENAISPKEKDKTLKLT